MQSPFDDADIREALIEALTRGVAFSYSRTWKDQQERSIQINLLGKSVAPNKPLRTFCILPPSKGYMMQEPIFPLDGLHAKFLLTDAECGIITSPEFHPEQHQQNLGIRS